MLNINKKAFTLVELIVVITILAILGTIGFISLQGYSSASRDSKRIADLGQVRTGIQLYQAKQGIVPEPSETKTIIGSGTTNLIIQGYAGTGVLNNIRVNDDAKDPLEDNYYTYSTNGAKTKFQLLALLENQETAYNVLPTTYANYENRNTYVIGDKIGIILDSTTNTPVQELGETEIDLSNNTTEYKAVFSKSDIQTLSGSSLHQEIVTKSDNTGVEEEPISTEPEPEPEPIVYSSCKEILDNGASTGDGTYTIDPENNGVGFDVYCDMTTHGGGWTRYLNIKGDYTASNSRNCWLGDYIQNTNIDCFNPNRYSMSVNKFMIKTPRSSSQPITFYTPSTTITPDTGSQTTHSSYYCLGNINYMTIMTTTSYPNPNGTDSRRVRLGLNFCGGSNIEGRNVGGISMGSTSNTYMNYSLEGKTGPIPGNRESAVKLSEIYIR